MGMQLSVQPTLLLLIMILLLIFSKIVPLEKDHEHDHDREQEEEKSGGAFRVSHDWDFVDCVRYFFTKPTAPHVTREQHFYCRRQWDGENWPEQSTDKQTPDENRN